MWEAYDLENEDFLWAGAPFLGGIGGYQNAPCGVVSASAVCLGLRPEFNRHFGGITCRELIGMDFSKPGEYQKFLESGIWKDKCEKYIEFMIETLYELETDRGLFAQAP